MPKRKKPQGDESDDESTQNDKITADDLDSAATPSKAPGGSPPGMKLRSGRKKRRRTQSPEKLNVGKDDEMEEDDDAETDSDVNAEDDDGDQKLPGDDNENGNHHHLAKSDATQAPSAAFMSNNKVSESATAADSTAARRRPPHNNDRIENLRLPHERTPARKQHQQKQRKPPPPLSQTPHRLRLDLLSKQKIATDMNGHRQQERQGPPSSDDSDAQDDSAAAAAVAATDGDDNAHVALHLRLIQWSNHIKAAGIRALQLPQLIHALKQLYRRWHAALVRRYTRRAANVDPNDTGAACNDVDEAVVVVVASSWTTRTTFWFAMLLLLQIMFYSFTIHPLWTSVVYGYQIALAFYSSLLQRNVSPLSGSNLIHQFQHEKSSHLRELDVAASQLQTELVNLQRGQQALAQEIEQLQTPVDDMSKSLQTAAAQYSTAVFLLQQAEREPSALEFSKKERLQGLLGDDEALLLDGAALELWHIPDEPCPDVPNALDREAWGHNLEALQMQAADDLQRLVGETDDNDESSSSGLEAVRVWLQQKVATVTADTGSLRPGAASSGSMGATVTKQTLERFLAVRMEVEMADRTGSFDYAALANGASVIRHGERATTPSLVDELPLYNRLVAHLGLRHYGYGPDMALLPTHPPDALGQCWAFARVRSHAHCSFGLLSIRLARPARLDFVFIDHPPQELTDTLFTAIRAFRVVGFENADATGAPWELGSFEFNAHGDVSQDFELVDIVNGQDVPKFASISVVIDSNWGMLYSCLYRLRVHGRDA